jgi:hypothetical protein
MDYRFPSAMGEADAAGWHLHPEYLCDVQDRARELVRQKLHQWSVPLEKIEESLNISIVELVLLAAQDCPSGEFILHDRNGNILREGKRG